MYKTENYKKYKKMWKNGINCKFIFLEKKYELVEEIEISSNLNTILKTSEKENLQRNESFQVELFQKKCIEKCNERLFSI